MRAMISKVLTGSMIAGAALLVSACGGNNETATENTMVTDLNATEGMDTMSGADNMTAVDGAMNGAAFLAYVQQFLAPTLQPGDTVVMDNLSSHKVAGVRDAIEARGAALLYLPPYSPDLNPIEQAFAKLKRLLADTMLDNVESALHARQESETQVRQFVADASHELRTPLASIRGYAELTRRETEPVPPTVTHAIGRVESEALRMQELVEDLLLLARLSVGNPTIGSQGGYDLMSIAAVVLGGTLLAGGKGNIMGTLAGVAIFAVIDNVMGVMQVNPFLRDVVRGVVIVVAVAVYARRELDTRPPRFERPTGLDAALQEAR